MTTIPFVNFLEKAGNKLTSNLMASNANLETTIGLENLCLKIKDAIHNRNTIFFFGNGGSAAEATHIAAEFTSHCIKQHEPWGAISLNDSISALTAISNDFNFEDVFKRQISGLVKKGDIAIGLTTSGTSKNVLKGLHEATERKAYSVLLTSQQMPKIVDYEINLVIKADSDETTRIQEIHLHWLHTIIEYLELNH
jgi:D-sedoheptulose 7-phosphate isomerase